MTHNAFSLLLKHRRLDEAIRAESARRWPDIARIQHLKRLKLAIKDRLFSLANARRRASNV